MPKITQPKLAIKLVISDLRKNRNSEFNNRNSEFDKIEIQKFKYIENDLKKWFKNWPKIGANFARKYG